MNNRELSVTLFGELSKQGISIEKVCKELKHSRPTVLNKLNNPDTLTIAEMIRLKNLLGLNVDVMVWG